MSHRQPPRARGLVFGALALMTGLIAGVAFERVYEIQIRIRPPDPIAVRTTEPSNDARAPLELRLVDSGGVGIPLDRWGSDYSHDRRVFREVILESSPYVDAAAFRRVEQHWRTYVERMRRYGNNAITVPLLLELIDFDRVAHRGPSPVTAVYDAASPFRARHAAIRRSFGPLFEWTARQGMQVFLETDMLTLSPPLAAYLRRLAPDVSPLGIDASNPAVWDVYRNGLEELFETMPWIAGIVIRFGEGGQLYNTEGWPYRSEMAIRSADSLRTMLKGLLPAFENSGRTLVLRSWTVGVGRTGRLHIDPRVYQAVLGEIDSAALVVSTKYTAGDFFSYLPLNPTLAQGRHRRLIELQAKPEFEGFSAFPDFLGREYAQALHSLRAQNPRIVGSYVFTQAGGPLRAGPRALYPVHGFWLWTDANVFVASRLAADPSSDVADLARQWAARTVGDDPRVIDAIARALMESRRAVLDGFYIRPFAEREVRVPGLELPPLIWIFEWDMLGGWHSLLSLVYRASRDDVDRAIEDGYASAAVVRRTRQELQTVFATADSRVCGLCEAALRSLEYQETLFNVLAAWRQTSLSYYRWLDTGTDEAWAAWRTGRARFETAAHRHVERFGNDLDFPAFDLTSATRAIAVAERGALTRSVAAAVAIVFVALMGLGGPFLKHRRMLALDFAGAVGRLMWLASVAPWHLTREPVGLRPAVMATALSLTIVTVLVGALTGFASPWVGGGSAFLFASVAIAFASSASADEAHQERGRVLIASVVPLIPGAIVLLALMAYVGPVGFWYWFWTSSTFRVVFVTIVVAMPLWTAYVIVAVRARDGWRGVVAGWLTAAGSGLLILAALLPDSTVTLRSLDRPLNLAPATDTMLFALQTYAGVRLDLHGASYIGALMLAAGVLTRVRTRRRTGSAGSIASSHT